MSCPVLSLVVARRKTQDILLNKQYMFISRGELDSRKTLIYITQNYYRLQHQKSVKHSRAFLSSAFLGDQPVMSCPVLSLVVARRKTQDILLNKQYMFISRGELDSRKTLIYITQNYYRLQHQKSVKHSRAFQIQIYLAHSL